MTQTKPCGCGCGKTVTRSSSSSEFYNQKWYLTRSHYAKKRKEQGQEMRRVVYTNG